MSNWVRLWLEMPTDPKWRVIARKSGQSISEVIAVFNFMMVCAANATERSENAAERGKLKNWNNEDVAIALDIDVDCVAKILQQMEGKVVAKGKLLGWEKRQPLREDGSAERSKQWRERNKETSEHDRTRSNATEQNREEKKDARPREAPSEVAPTLGAAKPWPQGRTNGHATEDVLMATKFTPAELERHKETHKIYVKRETPAGEAWANWTQKNTGHSQVWDAKGGWHFPSEWPPPSPSAS